MPGPIGQKGRRFADSRTMVKGIICRYRTGIGWRDLPAVFGPWETVWAWHHRMAGDGTWHHALAVIVARSSRLITQ